MEYNTIIFDQSMYFLPMLFMTFAVCVVLFFGTYINTQKGLLYLDVQRIVSTLVELTLVLSIILLFVNGWNTGSGFANTFSVGSGTILIQASICLFALMITLVSKRYLAKEKFNMFEYHVLIMLSVLGLLCLVASDTFMSIFLSIELQSLSFYVLASLFTKSEYSTEAGLKYFVLGAVATCFMLFGFSCVYGFTGSCDLNDIALILHDSSSSVPDSSLAVLAASASLVISGLLFKTAAVPFHFWVADVYEGSPTSVTAFFATVPKIALFFLMLRLLVGPFSAFSKPLTSFILVCSLLSIAIGTFSALYQKKLKRMMAYSAVTHTGFILLGCASLTLAGSEAVFTYLLFYSFMSTAMFSILLSVQNMRNKWLVHISDFSEFPKTSGLLSITAVLVLLSMAGIPPLAGFFGKLFVFASSVKANIVLPSAVAVIMSSIACVYYLRLFKIAYFDATEQRSLVWMHAFGRGTGYLLGVCLSIILLACFNPEAFMSFGSVIACSLL